MASLGQTTKRVSLWLARASSTEQRRTHPRRTPSTCKSRHHTHGTPRMAASTAFLTHDAGSTCATMQYKAERQSSSGKRKTKRKTCTGVHRAPTGGLGTGRKGAIEVPARRCQPTDNPAQRKKATCLDRGTASTSPLPSSPRWQCDW